MRLSITLGKKQDDWNMDDLLKELLSELELREEHWTPKPQRSEGTKGDDRSASALLAKSEDERCAYCLVQHAHESCYKVSNVKDRKSVARKYGQCFACLGKGHLSKDCRRKFNCKLCNKGGHHVSLCESHGETKGNILATNASPNMHVGSEGQVVFQTAQGIPKGAQNEARIRVVFDTGSHKSFVTLNVVRTAELPVKRKEC